MTDDFIFDMEEAGVLRIIDTLKPGTEVTAQRFFALLETGDEDEVTEAAMALANRGIGIDITDLPEVAGSGDISHRLALEKALVQEGRLPLGLEAGDPLLLYWKELEKLPHLSEEQAKALWGSDAGKDKLTEGLLYLVAEEAQGLAGRGVLLLDLMQEGALGLISCLEEPGENIIAAARWHIRQSMLRPILVQYLLSGEAQKLLSSLRAYQQADRSLLEKLGRNPSPEELAVELGKAPEEVAMLSKMTTEAAKSPATHQAPEQSPEEQPEAVEDSAYFQLRSRVEELLSSLDETDRQLLSLRFGLDGKPSRSTEEAASLLGLTPEETQKRELAAIVYLREQ